MLGFNEARWTPAHEKKLVQVLVELIAHGICPKEKLLGLGLTELPAVCFLTFLPSVPVPAAKRARLSSSKLPIQQHLELSTTTEPSLFLQPWWAKDLAPLGIEMGIPALIELLVEGHMELSKHTLRANSGEFKGVLWRVASLTLSKCTFNSPLASFENRGGLRSSDLLIFFDYIDYCSHLTVRNTVASQNRTEVQREVESLKADYVRGLEELKVPEQVLQVFHPKRRIVDWCSRSEITERPIIFAFAGDKIDDPIELDAEGQARFLHWLEVRKTSWRALRHRRRSSLEGTTPVSNKRPRRSNTINELPLIPPPVPLFQRNPSNGVASLTDYGAAIFRHLRAVGGLSKGRVPVAFAIAFTAIFKVAPPAELIPSAAAIDLAERRLAYRWQPHAL